MMLAVLTVPLLGFATTMDYIVLFAPKRAMGTFPGWLGAILGIDFLVAFLAPMVILAVNYFRLREVNERRRIRLVIFGLLLFLVNLLAVYSVLLISKDVLAFYDCYLTACVWACAGSFHHLCGVCGS